MGAPDAGGAGILTSSGYYDENADTFIAQTVSADMSALYARFLEHIPVGGSILDAGSGSGRDAAWFRAAGYEVEAFDASLAMVEATRRHARVPVYHMEFEEFRSPRTYDGIWACASLLHVRRAELGGVIRRLLQALNAGGCLYCSFKHGDAERRVEERYFNYMDEARLRAVVEQAPGRMLDIWITGDVRPGRSGEKWLNALIQRR